MIRPEVELVLEGGRHGEAINSLANLIHRLNEKWWIDLESGERLNRNIGEMIALQHSELSEALEAHRKNLMDDKLPHHPGVAVEFVDAIIRILDTAVGLGHSNIGEILVEKLVYNATRVDHTHEHRKGENGKKY